MSTLGQPASRPGLNRPWRQSEESRHGDAGGALLSHSPRRTFLESPQRTEEVKPHFASTQMSATTICRRICSKSQWPPWEVRLGEGRDGNVWVEDFQASEFCPPSVRGHENMKQLCGKKLVRGYRFHVPRKLIRFQEKGEGEISPTSSPQKGSDVPLAQFYQTGSSGAGARLQETLPPTLPAPGPLLPPHRGPAGNISSLPGEPW